MKTLRISSTKANPCKWKIYNQKFYLLKSRQVYVLKKKTAHSSSLIDANFALKSANENLKNGKNKKALPQLEKAEKAYLRYLSAEPSKKYYESKTGRDQKEKKPDRYGN